MNNKYKIGCFVLIIASLLISLLISKSAYSANYKMEEVGAEDEKLFSLECRNVDIKDILRAIAKENNLNLIISDDITAKVTLSFDKISLKDALDAILKSNKLDCVIEKNVMRIMKTEDLVAAKKEADKKEGEPKKEKEYVTQIVQLSYASAKELKVSLEGALGGKGKVSSDARTNSLLLYVEKDDVERVSKLVKELDTETKQIMIKAEIIETTEDFSKDIGVQWGGNYNKTSNNFPNTMSLTGASGSGTYAVNLPATTPTSAVGINFGSISKAINLDMRLSAMEKSGKINVVSNPRITTVNNKPAKIHSGITFRVRTNQETTTGSSTTSENTLNEIQAGIDLVVTPKISHDNLIELNIDVTKSEPDFTKAVDGIPGIIDKNANTTVVVKNGEATVIGGLKRNAKNEVTNSVPFFSKIPILGWFFRNESNVDSKEELVILITPVLIENNEGADSSKTPN